MFAISRNRALVCGYNLRLPVGDAPSMGPIPTKLRLRTTGTRCSSIRSQDSSSLYSNRHFGTTIFQRNSKESTNSSSSASSPATSNVVIATYTGPMAKTFYRLKFFSLGSLGLATALTPVFLVAASDLSLAGRLGLSGTALITSIVSTALVSWIGKPYVGRMKLLQTALPGDNRGQQQRPVIEAYTITWRMRTLQTRIYQPSLIRPTSRPFASWELPENPGTGIFPLAIPGSRGGTGGERILVSETLDAKSGKVLGKWWAQRAPGTASNLGQGEAREDDSIEFKEEAKCFAEGKPVRHFQVHEELLGEEWRILS